jgi:adenosylhomocysteine nucleosidase
MHNVETERHGVVRRLTDPTPRLGIVSAFGAEADMLVAQTDAARNWLINGNRFVTGRLRGNDVVIVLCGVGMVNAAMVTQAMLGHFQVERLLMSGIAGGVDPGCQVADVLVPERWTMPMEVYWSNDGCVPAPCGTPGDLAPLGLRLARDPQGRPHADYRIDTPFGPIATGLFLRDTYVMREGSGAEGDFRFDFPVDEEMLAVARALRPALRRAGPREMALAVSHEPRLLVGGSGASCGAFLANPAYRRYLHDTLRIRVIDMETASLAQVAYANRVPYLAFRSLSDAAGGDCSRDVGAFFGSGLAEANASAVTLAFLAAWADRPR